MGISNPVVPPAHPHLPKGPHQAPGCGCPAKTHPASTGIWEAVSTPSGLQGLCNCPPPTLPLRGLSTVWQGWAETLPWIRKGCLVASSKVSASGHSSLHSWHLPKVSFMSLVCTETCGNEHAPQLRWDGDIQRHTLCPGSDILEDQDRRCVGRGRAGVGRFPGEVTGSKLE